jgi:hypothetical protein
VVTTRRDKVPRPAQPAETIFAFRDLDRVLPADDVEWLVAQLRALEPKWQAAELVAERIEKSWKTGAAVETTLEEKRALIDAIDHSPRARSLLLRQLEIELHAAIFSERAP